MTKPVLFLDTDFIGNIFGQNSGDASRLNRVLDALSENYDVRITDRVWRESITENINPATGERYLKDTTLENWLNNKGINETVTGIPAGSNAGEQSIIHALNNPGSDPVLSDPNVPKYIASNDGYFNQGAAGGDFADNRVKSFDLVDRLAVDGHVSIEDYKGLSTEGSPDANWRPYQNVTADAVQAKYPDMSATYDPVNGAYVLDRGGQTLSLPEGAVHDGIHANSTGVLFDGQARALHNLGKYAGALDKAGWIGDVLGTAWAIAEAQAAYSNGDNHSAGSILAGHTGGLLGGLGLGTISAAGVTALLAVPGVNIGVAAGMLLVGAAGLAGGYLGGSAGESMFKDLYEEISGLGIVGFSQQLYDDYKWGLSNPSEVFNIGNLMELVQSTFGTAITTGSPLVLDIAGTGINLTSVNTSPVYWDIDVDGMREASGWIGAGSGLLAIDLDSNGKIDDHSELFGDQNGSAANGFQALAAYDSNSDGVIDANDDQFADLLIWMDANGDGLTDAGELFTLTSLDITSINLNYSSVNYTLNDNVIRQQSTFTMNGQTHDIVDAWFTYDNTNTSYAGEYDLDVRALILPAQRGYGEMADLHIAMSQNEDLLDMVATLATKSAAELFASNFDVRAALTDIMYEWAGVTDMDPNSRGTALDARMVAFLEKLNGDVFGNSPTSTVGGIAAAPMREAWNAAFSMVATHFLAQSGMNDLLGNPSYDLRADNLSGGYFGEDLTLRFTTPFASGYWIANDSGFNDVYVFRAGDAPHSNGLNIHETVSATNDAIFLGGIDPANVRLWTDNYGGLVIRYTNNDSFTISASKHSSGASRVGEYVEFIMFDDGTTWDLREGLDLRLPDGSTTAGYGSIYGDTIEGGSGTNHIYGYAGNDTLTGNGGTDYLYGGIGDDTYTFKAGHGQDTIYEYAGEGTDTIRLEGVLADDVLIWAEVLNSTLSRLYIQYGATDKITVSGGTYNSSTGATIGPVEQVVFDDDTVWDLTGGLMMRLPNGSTSAVGTAHNDTIIGGTNNDHISGGDGNDTLYGGAGSDHLFGGDGDDFLSGGIGSNGLNGGAGADIFHFDATALDGSTDTISDFSMTDGDVIDIRDVLDGAYDPLTDNLADFVKFQPTAYYGLGLRIDLDGTGTAYGWQSVANLSGYSSLPDVDTLVANGHLLAA